MSIRIGTRDGISSTTNERIYLKSSQSDTIVLQSSNENVPINIVYNGTYRFGNLNGAFHMSDSNQPAYMTASKDGLRVLNTLNVSLYNTSLQGNIQVSQTASISNISASNIGTQSLTASNVITQNVSLQNIRFGNCNIVTLASNQTPGACNQAIINADMIIRGSLTLDQPLKVANAEIANLAFPSLTFTTNNTSNNVLEVRSRTGTVLYDCNLLSIEVNDIPSFTVTNYGKTGINTGTPTAFLHIANPSEGTDPSNLLTLSSSNGIVGVTNSCTVGIGTSSVQHKLHIWGCNVVPLELPSPLIGVYTSADSNMTASSIMIAYSNEIPVMQIQSNGAMVLGYGQATTNAMLQVNGLTEALTLTTSNLRSLENEDLYMTTPSLRNTGDYYGANIYASGRIEAFDMFSSTLTTCNLDIPGVILNETTTAFQASKVSFTGPNITFGSRTLENRNLATEGKVLIEAPASSEFDTAVALEIVGTTSSRNVIRIATRKPAYDLFANTTDQRASHGIDNLGYYLSYATTGSAIFDMTGPRQLQLSSFGMRIARSIQIATTNTVGAIQTGIGFMGLGLPTASEINPALPQHRLHVHGSVWVQSSAVPASSTTAPNFFVQESTGRVGIRTNNPQQDLHVEGVISCHRMITTQPIVTTSDARLKEDLQPIMDALQKVNKLTGYTYIRTGSSQRETGLIAQDVNRVLPEAVMQGDQLGVTYGNMAGLFVEAIKALTSRIEDLEKQLKIPSSLMKEQV